MLDMNQDDTNKLYTDFTFIHKFEKDDFNPPDKSTPELLGKDDNQCQRMAWTADLLR